MMAASASPSIAAQIKALTSRKSDTFAKTTDPAFLVAIQNLRQVLALLAGITAGLMPVTGWNGFLIAAFAVIFSPFWYSKFLLGVPFGAEGQLTPSEILGEGMVPVS
jgi:hypothetical protein